MMGTKQPIGINIECLVLVVNHFKVVVIVIKAKPSRRLTSEEIYMGVSKDCKEALTTMAISRY